MLSASLLLQALLAGSSFCAFAAALKAAAPALTPADFPHLEAFAKLAKEFPVQKRSNEDEEAQQSQRRAPPEQPQRISEPEHPQPESQNNQAEPAVEGVSNDAGGSNTVAPSEAGSEASKADAQAEGNSSAAAPASQAAAEADAKPRGARSDSKADAKEPIRAEGKEAKAAAKGGRASSRQPSSDGGPEGNTGKLAPKAPSNAKVSYLLPSMLCWGIVVLGSLWCMVVSPCHLSHVLIRIRSW